MIQIIKNPGPNDPFTIRESQLHAIDRLATPFHNIKPQQPTKTNAKVVPREVPTVAPQRMPFIVPSPRVPMMVVPPRVIEPRIPLISQEDKIKYIRKMEMAESNKVQQQCHQYPTIVTQMSQETNQAEHTPT